MFFEYSCFLFGIIVDNWRQITEDIHIRVKHSNLQTKAETMKITDRLERLCQLYKCELVDDGNSWKLFLPKGTFWKATGNNVNVGRYSYSHVVNEHPIKYECFENEAIEKIENDASRGTYSNQNY